MSPRHDALSRGVGRTERAARVACLLVPDLPLRAELRAHPELAEQTFAIAAGSDARAEILGVSPSAFRAGVRTRSSVVHARAICSHLQIRVLSPALERATRQALLDVALSFSPRALAAARSAWAFTEEAAVFLDASGITGLFESERHFASAIAARAERLGLPAAVAIASSRSVAQIAARQSAMHSPMDNLIESSIDGAVDNAIDAGVDRAVDNAVDNANDGVGNRTERPQGYGQLEHGSVVCILPAGSEARFLGPLHVDLLDPDDALGQQLTRFGVRTVQDLLRLPRRALARRLGPKVLELAALARGEETLPPIPVPKDASVEEAIDLETPIELLEPLLFVLRGLISRLVERLALRQLACGPLDLQLGLQGGGRDARQVGVAAATRDVRVLLRVVALALETHPPPAAVETISLATRGQPARRDQLDFFVPRGPDPNALDRTLSELESLCGTGRVGAPEVADDHRPEAFGIKPFGIRRASEQSESRSGVDDRAEVLAVRALRPPIVAEVRVHRGVPTSLRSAVASGDVLHASGPWRTTGRWWSESERYALDYFDVQVSDGSLLRICFDWIHRVWRIDGIYD